jgi:hypothetical protein
MERRNRPSRWRHQEQLMTITETGGSGKTRVKKPCCITTSWLNKVLHAHQLDTVRKGGGGGGFLLSHKNYLYTSGATQDFLLSITLMTTHFSMAPGMEPEWLFADLMDFYLFFLTLMGWLSESIIAQKMVMVRYKWSTGSHWHVPLPPVLLDNNGGAFYFFCLRLVFGWLSAPVLFS